MLIELRERTSLPLTEFPDECTPLPSELTLPSIPDTYHLNTLEEPRSSSLHDFGIGWLARQVQTVRLYDQFLKTVNSSGQIDFKLQKLKHIDEELQDLLRLALNEPASESWKTRCAVTATILR